MAAKKGKVIPPKPKYKETTLLIEQEIYDRRGYKKPGRSPLDAELAHEDAMLAQDLKSMRVEEMVLKRRKRMKQYEKEIDELDDPAKSKKRTRAPGINLAMASKISKLPEAEQQKIMQTFAIFRNIDDPVDRGSLLLPMLVGYSKQNPQSSQLGMENYAKAMSDSLKLGVDVMKAAIPPQTQGKDQTLEYLKLFIGMMNENQKLKLQQQSGPGFFESMIQDPNLFDRMKTLFTHKEGGGEANQFSLQIEQLRGERDMAGRKMDLEWKIKMLEMDEKSKRTDTMLQALTPLSALFAGPIDQRMRNMGRQQANPTYQPPVQHQTATAPPPSTIIDVTCATCGYTGEQPTTTPPPPQIQCPGCGVALNVGGPPTGST